MDSISLEKKTLKIRKAYLLLISLIIADRPITAHANLNTSTQLIYFESDTLTYTNKPKLGIYQGHVRLTQGSGSLTADYAISYFDRKGQITKIVARGNPARYQAFVFSNRPKLIATGKTIYYYPQNAWLEAVGNAEIVQGQNHFKGYQINYDFKTKTISSPISQKGHTQIIIAPLKPS